MKPPQKHQAAHFTNQNTRTESQQRLWHAVAVNRTFALQNEFTPPAIRTIWTAMEQSRRDADDEQRRKKK